MWSLIMNVFIPVFATVLAVAAGYIAFPRKRIRKLMLLFNKNVWTHVDHKSFSAALQSVLPLSTAHGWTLFGADNGKRLWLQTLPSLSERCPIFATHSIIETSPKEVVSTLSDTLQQPDWDPLATQVNVVTPPTFHDGIRSDVIKILDTRNKTSHTVTRCWKASDIGCCWLLSLHVDGYLGDVKWSYWNAEPIETEGLDGFAVVSLFVGTSFPCQTPPVCLSSWLQSLQQHVTLRQCETNYNSASPQEPILTVASAGESSDNQRGSDSGIKVYEAAKSTVSHRSRVKHNKQLTLDSQRQSWVSLCDESALTVQTVALATAENGWELVNQQRGVTIMKKSAVPGDGLLLNRVKGTAVISVPPFFIVSYIGDFEKSKQWNEMFDYGEIIEEVMPGTRVSRLAYKSVFPATARDFCLVSGVRQLDDHTFITAVSSVTHPACIENKNYVRAESSSSGFAIVRDPNNSARCTVTYTTLVDLKGRVPTFVVNKVSSSQPMCVAVLRDLVERDYRALSDEERQRWQEMTLREYIRRGKPEEDDEEEEREDGEFSEEGGEAYDIVQEEEREREQMEGSGDVTESLRSGSESEIASVQESASTMSHDLNLPLTSESEIDYRTLGNQMCGAIMAEFLLASAVDLYSPKKSSGGWTFQCVEKDVLILKKSMPNSKFDGFMGKGIINLPPSIVWEAVKDSRTRFTYDNMLKSLDIVEEIESGLHIVYCVHEAKNCFVKQARDLCYLHCEREDSSGKFIVAGRSIEHPRCPLKPNVVRAYVIASGWQIEPLQQEGRTVSSVSYLVQVNLGGMVPVRLLNLIAKRQPLAVAYLREYLTSS